MFVFVHVETTEKRVAAVKPYVEHSLHTGVACAVEWRQGRGLREKWLTFVSADVFWAWLVEWQRKRQTLWVVCHDGMRTCTILNLWDRLETHQYTTTQPGYEYKDRRTGKMRQSEPWKGLIAIEGRPFHVETVGPRGRVNFTDVRNYYHCPLEELTEMHDWPAFLEYDTGNRDRCKKVKAVHLTRTIKQTYLNLVARWEREHNGNWHFSAAGLAWSNYRHKHMQEEIILHQHAEAMNLEWQCLYGGECRCWFRGVVNKPLLEYDVNSLYPYMMLDRPYPTALIDHFKGDCYDKLAMYIDKYACAADVTLRTDVDFYPYRQGKQTLYPVGEFRTQLCGPELLVAYDRGDIRQVHALSIYTVGKLFSSYVRHWWEEKSRCKRWGDKAGEKFAKLMLNSLPAKFAQKTPVWLDNRRIDVVRPWKIFPWRDNDHAITYPARSIGWRGQHLAERVPTENSFPLIYAYVCAYAREHMRLLRQRIAPSCLYYQDTDSLIVAADFLEEGGVYGFHIGDYLGQFRLKGQYGRAEFRGKRNYTVDDANVISGVTDTDHYHGNCQWTGERIMLGENLFNRPKDGKLIATVVDFEKPGDTRTERYGPDGWALPVRLP